MATSITEIARLANLSANTVSRALRGMTDVKEETSARIHLLAKELGYTPNRFAQGLVSKKSKLIALALTEPESNYQSTIVHRLRELIKRAGYQSLMMEFEYEDADRQMEVLSEFAGLQVDGVIIGAMYGVLSEMPVWEPLQYLKRRKIPFVVYGLGSSRKVNMVTTDYYHCAIEMTEAMIVSGKRNILLLEIVPHSERTLGYTEAMLRHKLPPNVVYVSRSNMSNGYSAIGKYLDAGNRLPEVVLARNDEMAIGILSALRDRSIRVPEDVWVAGFDNMKMSSYCAPRLTSAWVDPISTADKAADILLRHIENSNLQPEQYAVNGKLFFRESTGNIQNGSVMFDLKENERNDGGE